MNNNKLTIAPAWLFLSEQGDLLEPTLFRLLAGIRDTGKLTDAARRTGISYRHGWNLLNRAGEVFGLSLVNMRKGRGTTLSELGETLLWAEHRVKARLGPQLDSMAAELNGQIQHLRANAETVLRLHASHGYAVALLTEFSDQLSVNLQYRNPEEALSALNRGDCDLASLHFPTDPALARDTLAHYHHLLAGRPLRLIRFVTRSEGLMMRPDTTPPVRHLSDLAKQQLRFIGRDHHSGTRVLFNRLLQHQGLAEADLNLSPQQEFTHTAVAAFVAAGMADVGFGVEAAAAQFGLRFQQLAREHYLLVCHQDRLEQPGLTRLRALMASEAVVARIGQVPGYQPDHPGEVTTFEALLGENPPG